MQNVKMTVTGDKLVIEIALAAKGTPSASGKSLVIATTSGNVPIPEGKGAMLGLNVYRPNR